jgi:chromosome segregation ATPase
VESHAVELLELFAKLEPASPAPPTQTAELARLVRLEWERTGQVRAAAADAADRRAEATRGEEEIAALRSEVALLLAERDELADGNRELRSRLAEERALAAQAAGLAAEIGDLRARLARAVDDALALRGEIDAIYATRTMRVTRRARSLYGRALRLSRRSHLRGATRAAPGPDPSGWHPGRG